MTANGRDILTHSRMQTFKTCARKHHYRYNLGFARAKTTQALRFGTSFHWGLDMLAQGVDLIDTCRQIRESYETIDGGYETRKESETIQRLLCGYYWRWGNDGLKAVASELAFELPIRNPQTKATSRTYRVAGVIDKIVRLLGRPGILEHKTTGFSIQPDSDYWRRIAFDQQVTLYLWAARKMGMLAENICWDAIHKPGIGRKNEPIEDFGVRLAEDITRRPDFYYARREVPRLQADIDEFLDELWQIAKAIRQAELCGRHYRNTGACAAPYRCEYLDICQTGYDPDAELPAGYVWLDDIHPELTRSKINAPQACPETA